MKLPNNLPLWKRVLFGVVTFVLITLMFEGGLRLLGLKNGFVRALKQASYMSPEVFAESIGMFRPGYSGRVAWPRELAFDMSVDARGFRGRAREQSVRDRYRILCLGDSTTFGLFVDEGETYPQFLEAELTRRGIEAEVINGGVPGWGTHDHLRFLRERAHRVEPDLVLHLFCHNDLANIGADVAGAHGAYARLRARIARASWADWFRSNTALGECESRIKVLWKSWRNGPLEAESYGELTAPEHAAWEAFRSVHAQLAAECRARGYSLVTCAFPESSKRMQSPHEPALAAIAKQQAVPFVPLWQEFRVAEAQQEDALYHVPIDPHANRAGYRVFARVLVEQMEKLRVGPFARR